MKKIKNHSLFLISLVILLIFLSIVSMSFGDVKISVSDTYRIMFKKIITIFSSETTNLSSEELIIGNIRLPRILTAIFTGAGLSAVGCAYQGVFRNPMADPYILGISSGATLGAAIMIVLNLDFMISPFSFVTIGAFIGAILTTLLVYSIASRKGRVDTASLLLSGIAVSFLLSSIVTLIIVFNEKNVSKIIFWTMGNLSGAGYSQLKIIIPSILLGSIFLYAYSRDLDGLSAGEDVARTLGINTQKLKKLILVISSFLVAVCVSFTGIIGFVGLIVPHIMRIITGPLHKRLIPYSMIGGAIFLVLSDTIARSAVDSAELPVGAVTALFGAPFFIYLLIKRKRGE